ncbi:hypothetical protein FQN54_002880 [Arachnomyces sp. PD_36]|nr:hypothetical protein FQN54_002880 [Arachnomyces sp. PD_36]
MAITTSTNLKGHPDVRVSPSTDEDGSGRDQADMARLGKKQELNRNFRFLSILGFTCTLMATWESILLTSTYGLVNGGMAGMIYVYIGSFIGFFAVVASMAEIASMSPTSGGQYHWVSEYAEDYCQRFLSYITVLNHPTYVPERWHGTLFTIAIAVISTFVNTYGANQLPTLEKLILILHVFGFFAVMIPLWVMAPRTPTETVFTEFTNAGGWSSMGLACLVGQLTPIFSFLGPDAATHMAEEIRDASRVVPWCMISTALINGTLGFIILITFLFTLGDVESVLEPPTGFSFMQAFVNATQSNAAASGLSAIILALEVCSAISILATTSRQTFAFARDDALPFSSFFRYIHPRSKVPVNSILTTTLITTLLSLINIGSTAAFNAIASLTIASLFMSYLIPIICFCMRRFRDEPMPPARWSLGQLGLPVNIFSILYLMFAVIFTFFPTTAEVTLEDMNWSILVFGVVFIFAVVQYAVHGKNVYEGPVKYVEKME